MKKNKQKLHVMACVKAARKAGREMELAASAGFKATTRVHKSKKNYNRKEGKKIDFEPSFFCA